MNRNETQTLLDYISTLWGRRKADQATIEEWQAELGDIPLEQARTIVRTMAREGHAGPSLAAILGQIPWTRTAPRTLTPEELQRYASARINAYNVAETALETRNETRSDDEPVSQERANQWLNAIAYARDALTRSDLEHDYSRHAHDREVGGTPTCPRCRQFALLIHQQVGSR